MKCANCGAPLGNTDEVCAYCETVTPYGERVRRNRQNVNARLLLSTLILQAFEIHDMSAWTAFRVRNILRDYAEKYIGIYEAEKIAAPSGLALFIFGTIYLHYAINRMIDANIFTPDNKFREE